MFHWLFALSFTGAYLTSDSERWRLLHVTLGYSLAALLVWRVLYGVLGPRPTRLGVLAHKLSAARSWLTAVRAQPGAFNRHARQGQYLGMALTVTLMLVLTIPLTLSGYATYHEWGGSFWEDALEEIHEFFGNAFLAAVLGHVGLIALTSLIRRENMARPMLSGRLPGPGPSPVRHNRFWLACLLLVAWLAFGAWQWESTARDGLATPWSVDPARDERDDHD